MKKFVADTALDGVGQVLAEDQEKISRDYKIMKNLSCKGGEPGLMTLKVDSDNPLLKNMDINKTKTKLEKEIDQVKLEQMTKEDKEKLNKKRLELASQTFDEDEEEEMPAIEEAKPTSVVAPRYKVVHSYPTDIGDAWGGYTTA